jgi:flagellar biosynthetic protein FliO
MDLFGQMAAVTVVLLLLGATLWILRRRGFAGVALTRRPGRRRLECIERLPLGPHQVLHLVRVGDLEVLVSSSPAGCTLLKSFEGRAQEVSR